MSSNLEQLKTWFDRVWHQGDASAIDEMFAESGEARGLGDHPRIGPKDFREFHTSICALMEKIKIDVDHSMEEGNTIYALCSFRALKKSDQSPVTMGGIVLVTYQDGKIADAYNHWDFIGLFQQLGSMPPQSLSRCLSGKSIA